MIEQVQGIIMAHSVCDYAPVTQRKGLFNMRYILHSPPRLVEHCAPPILHAIERSVIVSIKVMLYDLENRIIHTRARPGIYNEAFIVQAPPPTT